MKDKAFILCKGCSNLFKVPQKKRSRRFCSLKCYYVSLKEKKVLKSLENNSFLKKRDHMKVVASITALCVMVFFLMGLWNSWFVRCNLMSQLILTIGTLTLVGIGVFAFTYSCIEGLPRVLQWLKDNLE